MVLALDVLLTTTSKPYFLVRKESETDWVLMEDAALLRRASALFSFNSSTLRLRRKLSLNSSTRKLVLLNVNGIISGTNIYNKKNTLAEVLLVNIVF